MSILSTNPTLKNKLLEQLHDSTKSVCVTFTKVSGETRVMRCTQSNSLIPTEKHPKQEEAGGGTVKRVTSPDVCRVFDLDKQEWRSFKYDSVTQFEVV